MSTNVCVVERPLNPPYCCVSSLSLTISRIQPPTIDSKTFESVDVKDIGRIGLTQFSVVGWSLGQEQRWPSSKW
jgi:hypothetical protein